MKEPSLTISKPGFLRHILESENAFIHIDPRPAAVVVPKRLKSAKHTVFQVGPHLHIPVSDLQIEDALGFSCTLSFDRCPFKVFVPWGAVFGIVGETTTKFQLWPDSVSADLAAELREQEQKALKAVVKTAPVRVVKRPNKAGLRLVKNGE